MHFNNAQMHYFTRLVLSASHKNGFQAGVDGAIHVVPHIVADHNRVFFLQTPINCRFVAFFTIICCADGLMEERRLGFADNSGLNRRLLTNAIIKQ